MAKRLLIVEEALKNRRGHWYEYNLAIVVEARRQGIDVTVLTHRDLEEDLRREFNATPFFPVTSWDGGYYHTSILKRYLGLLRHNLLICRLLGRHFTKTEQYDVVLVPTVVLYHWLGWRWLTWRFGGTRFKKVVLTTRNNAGEYDSSSGGYRFNSSAKILRLIVRSFGKSVGRGLVEMASDSHVLCRQYQSLTGIPFHTYPHPRTLSVPTPSEEAKSGRSAQSQLVTLAALGPPRLEKGSDLILEAIAWIRANRPELPVRFIFQWTDKLMRPSGEEVLPAPELLTDSQVELIRSDLSSNAYLEKLMEADALLVTYRRNQYHARLSGVAIEAFQAGIPCICISNTWIAEAMDTLGAGIALEREDVGALVEAIITLVQNSSEYAEKARLRASIAREVHSPKAFVDQLINETQSL
jgi:glycosyltransferase involved in cell wall biosynthesis